MNLDFRPGSKVFPPLRTFGFRLALISAAVMFLFYCFFTGSLTSRGKGFGGGGRSMVLKAHLMKKSESFETLFNLGFSLRSSERPSVKLRWNNGTSY